MIFRQVAGWQTCEGEGITNAGDEVLVMQGLDIAWLQVGRRSDVPCKLLALDSGRSRFLLGVSGWAHEDAKRLVGFR